MDTRRKILTVDAARAVTPARPLALVAGYFDVLRAEHARELEAVRRSTSAAALMVVVLPLDGELQSLAARAALVAAMRMVDYVVTGHDSALDLLVRALAPDAVVRLEEADRRRTRQLIEHVRQRQTR